MRWLAGILVACLAASAQTPEFLVDLSQPRALQEAIRRLSLRTGWPISYEDPVWPQGTNNPLANERLVAALLVPASADQRARTEAVAQLVATYNQENPSMKFTAESAGTMTLVKAATPAALVLDQMVEIPRATRYPHEHGVVIVKTLSQISGVSTSFITTNGLVPGVGSPLVTFDTNFLGRTIDPRQALWEIEQTDRTRWGTVRMTARAALLSLLAESRTTMPWDITCFPETPARCELTLLPVSIETRDLGGCPDTRAILCDRK